MVTCNAALPLILHCLHMRTLYGIVGKLSCVMKQCPLPFLIGLSLLQVDMVVFDKTGTLTQGKMQLASVQPSSGVSEDEVLRWAAAAESSARHPLAEAVQAAAESAGIEMPHSTESATVPGSGVRATVDGQRWASDLPCIKPFLSALHVERPQCRHEQAAKADHLIAGQKGSKTSHRTFVPMFQVIRRHAGCLWGIRSG